MMKKESLEFKSLGDTIKGALFLPDIPSDKPYPAVILCHGAIDYKEHFFDFSTFLAEHGYAALALDMHGHGESEGTRYNVRMAEWVPDIMAAVACLTSDDRIDDDRIGALGFSSGGTAILETAVQNNSLKALVTLDATVQTVITPLEVAFFSAVSGLGHIKRKLIGRDIKFPLYDLAVKVPVSCDPDVSKAFHNDPYFESGYKAYPMPGAIESLIIDTIKRVDKIVVPVCIIHGEQDKVDSPESARLLYKKLRSKKQLNIIPNSGHVGHMDYQKEQIQMLAKEWFDAHL